jgi:type IV pilus assembly protein PilW
MSVTIMTNLRGSQRGLTLIEIVIAVTLGTIVLALIGSLFVASLAAWRRGSDVREAQVQASTLVDVMARDIRNASQAPSVTIKPQITLDEGEPILSIAATGAASQDAPWIVYVRRPEQRDVVRYAAAPGSGGRIVVKDTRIVAFGVERVDVSQVANGVTIEVEVRRGREVAISRASAAPRNP